MREYGAMTDTFTTPNGTYGGTMKPNAIFKFILRQQVKSLKRPSAKRAGRAAEKGIGQLVLRTVGRKSGSVFETPVAYWPESDGSWLVCASAAGAQRHPVLVLQPQGQRHGDHLGERRGDPGHRGRTPRSRARDGVETITRTAPGFLGYTKKTDRVLPVIELTRA